MTPRKKTAFLIFFGLLFFLTIIGSGVAMSRAVLPLFGLTGSTGSAWFALHKWSSMLTLALVGVKLVLHRTWFAAVVKKLGRQRDRVHRGDTTAQTKRRAAL